MERTCAYCGVGGVGRAMPFGLCAPCFTLLEDELTAAAVRVGRVGRHDAETVADVPLPVLLPSVVTNPVAQHELW
ncbi:hypothetical protein J0H58_20270 [bacterium]|nr:hypothetical protein [bacterium]